MEKVVFNETDQNRTKRLSKAIYIIAKIMRVFITIAAVCMVLVMATVPYMVNNVDIKGDLVTLKDVGSISLKDLEIDEVDKADKDFIDSTEKVIVAHIKNIFNNHSKLEIIIEIETTLLFVIVYLVIIIMGCRYVVKLFSNISKEGPFILDNVELIKKLAIIFIIAIVLSNVGGIPLLILTGMNFDLNIDLGMVGIVLVLFTMMYVFKYGCLLQSSSKKRIYGDIDE